MSWLNPPPVVVVSGTQEFMRRREVEKALAGAQRTERRVEFVKGSDTAHFRRVLASGNPLFKSKVLAVVCEADKVPAEPVVAHYERGSNRVSLVLLHEGAIKKGNLSVVLKKIDKKFHIHFKDVAPWKREQQAVGFLVEEAKRLKIRLSEKIAKVIVQAAGTDLGILVFELRKVAALLQAKGEEEVQTGHLRQTLATLSQVGGFMAVDALGVGSEARLVRALGAMKRTHVGNPTMKACGLLTYNISQWLHAAALLGQNAEVDEISTRLGIHPYVCKTKVVPIAQKWGEKSLARLLTALAEIERGVKLGHVNSWVELECALLRGVRQMKGGLQ